jgi:DNA-binding GntR family transcriptional regulator
MSQAPKHHLIYQTLASEIGTGKYRDTGKLPSETQLVNRFQVSRPTVIRALRDLQADGLVTRRAGAGTFLNQLPPRPCRPLQVVCSNKKNLPADEAGDRNSFPPRLPCQLDVSVGA